MLFDFFKKYEIIWLRIADKLLEKVPKAERVSIIDQVDVLNKLPETLDLKKLRGYKNLYRLRVGDYRIIIKNNRSEKVALIVYLGHRKEVYESLKRTAIH